MKKKGVLSTILGVVLVVAALPALAGTPTVFDRIAGKYEAIRLALYHGTLEGIAENAHAIQKTVMKLDPKSGAARKGVTAEKAGACEALLPQIAKASEALASAKDLGSARQAFYELSKPMVQYRDMIQGPRPIVVFCPMAKKSWLQPEGEIGNPYYGQKMPHCGTIVSK